jgi:ABC-type cobalamin/Fe3+-siderophores transport system ATPase subunit
MMTAVVAAECLEARDVHFRRGPRVILSDITLRLHSGEIVALLGANGAGKSTLFRILLGFLKPERGEVRLNDRLLTAFHPDVTAKVGQVSLISASGALTLTREHECFWANRVVLQ